MNSVTSARPAESFSDLEAAKVERRKAAAAVKKELGLGAAKAAAWDLIEARVRDGKQQRSAAVAAIKPVEVRRISEKLLDDEAALECAAADVEASKSRLKDLRTAFDAADAAVKSAGAVQLNALMVEVAKEIERGLDALLGRGDELRELAMGDGRPGRIDAPLTVPPEVERALERLSKLINPLDVPVNVLRGGGIRSGLWAKRLAQLTADEQQED